MNKYGYLKVAASVPELKVANVTFNTEEIIKEIKTLAKEKVKIVTFPELSITGYTCADLFFQQILLDESLKGLEKIVKETKDLDIISIVGLPMYVDNNLLNVAAVLSQGKVLGIIPKTYIPNYGEFYEKRWFSSSLTLKTKEINLFGNNVLIGKDLIFVDKNNREVAFGVEICEDLWRVKNPSNDAVLNGATIIFNLSASNEVIGKYEYRKNLIKMTSAKLECAYVYASTGINESTTDLAFPGFATIYELGTSLGETPRFEFTTQHLITDIDILKIKNERIKSSNFMDDADYKEYRKVEIEIKNCSETLTRTYKQYPFVPSDEALRNDRCSEIINIQASSLAKRLKHLNNPKCVIGISGGLDSTLAFLVIIAAFKKLGIDNKNLIGVTMPGFGTTGRTYNNSIKLMKSYEVTIKEINIAASCLQHFKDISLDESDRSITYENTQARERTQILMDIANKENGIVIGTGDLSELALGWCTYNGDHMSMYAVNTSIPKTLVSYLVKYFALNEENKECQKTIEDILATPISPELLPPDKNGKIEQKTENIVGPYILHDFYLYHFLRNNFTPEKIKYIAISTFKDMYTEEEITKWLNFFIKKFFAQQFKRSCLPDGPKVGTISLSPRGDLRMPSDADNSIWLK